MSTLFGRSKKHRSRTISTASNGDGLETSSVPYASTSRPSAPPTPRGLNGLGSPAIISSDGTFSAPQDNGTSSTAAKSAWNSNGSPYASTSKAVDSGHAGVEGRTASMYSVSSQHSSKRPMSPTVQYAATITPPVNLIPEHRPYSDAHAPLRDPYAEEPARTVQRAQSRNKLRRHPSNASDSSSAMSIGRHPSDFAHESRRPSEITIHGDLNRQSSTASARSEAPPRSKSPSFDGEFRVPRGSIASVASASRSSPHQGSLRSNRGFSQVAGAARSQQARPSISSIAPSIQAYPYSHSSSHGHGASNSSGMTSSDFSMRTSRTSIRSVASSKSSSSLNGPTHASLPPPATPNLASSEFNFPRPGKDRDIEVLFQKMLDSKVPPDRWQEMQDFPIAKKWAMVYNDVLQDWKSSRPTAHNLASPPLINGFTMSSPGADANFPAMNMIAAQNSANSIMRSPTQSPEWYLGKIIHGNVQPAEISSLTVALRTYELAWVKEFIVTYKGLSALSSALAAISRLPLPLSDHQTKLEAEIAKCVKTLLGIKIGADEAMAHPHCINEIALSLASPNIAVRKLCTDMMTFLAYWNEHAGHKFVLRALDHLMTVKQDKARFDAWFTMLEATIDGRGKMGSMVGASAEIRTLRGKEAQLAMQQAQSGATMSDSVLNEYLLVSLWLVNAVSLLPADYQVRVHLRQQMEHAGLGRILMKMRALNHPQFEVQIKQYEEYAEKDYQEVVKMFEQDVLRDFKDPWDVFRALLSSVEGTRAYDFFVSALQHLLLIREEGEPRVRYFQLIDSVITSIVLDRKGIERDFTDALGFSVSSLVNKFSNEERLADLESQVDTWHRLASKLKRERNDLQEELDKKDEGIVNELNQKVSRLEEDLTFSRQATELLRQKVQEQDHMATERISQAEGFSQELFQMLKEARTSGESDQTQYSSAERANMVSVMERKMERIKTIQRLEGQHLGHRHPSADSSEGSSRRTRPAKVERQSAFEDADDQAVRDHIENSLQSGALDFNPSSTRLRGSQVTSTRARERSKNTPSPNAGSHRVLNFSPIQNGPSSAFSQDNTPQASAHSSLLQTKRLQSSNDATPTGPARFGGRAMPANLLASLRARGTDDPQDDNDDETPSMDQSSPKTPAAVPTTPERPVKSHMRRPTEDSIRSESPTKLDSPSRNIQSQNRSVPQAPPAPPLPGHLPSSSSAFAIPAPPIPPPLPGKGPPTAPSAPSAPSAPLAPPAPPMPPALLNGLSGITSQLLEQKNRLKPNAKIVDEDAVVGPAGSLVSHPDTGIWKRPAPGAVTNVPVPAPPPMKPAVNRKNNVVTAKRQLKQVVWEKMNPTQIANTIWVVQDIDEKEWASRLASEGVFEELEEEYKAKQVGPIVRRKKDDLRSVLDDKMRERLEILVRKNSSMDDFGSKILDITRRLLAYDTSLCTAVFLGELQLLLPSPDLVGKLNQHKTDDESDLALLAPADRFLVELIKIPFLSARIEGMLYRAQFAEKYADLLKEANQLYRACESLRSAKHFAQLLKLILMLGNYMNAQGWNGGAFGFRIGSINRLVDTKGANGQSLLHTLERTISTKFPDMSEFLDELSGPIEAFRISLKEVRKESAKLREDLQSVSNALKEHFQDILDDPDSPDSYPRLMFRFVRNATSEVASLTDRVTLAETSFSAVVTYFGAEESVSSEQFFGDLNTFVSSYRRAQAQNDKAAEEKAAAERRRAAREAAQESKQAKVAQIAEVPEDGSVMEDLFSKLRAGRDLGSRTRARKAHGERTQRVQSPNISQTSFERADPAETARGLLAQIRGSESLDEILSTSTSRPERRTLQPIYAVPSAGSNAIDAPAQKSPSASGDVSMSSSSTVDASTSSPPRNGVTSHADTSLSAPSEDSMDTATPVVRQGQAFLPVQDAEPSSETEAITASEDVEMGDTSLIALDDDALAVARLA